MIEEIRNFLDLKEQNVRLEGSTLETQTESSMVKSGLKRIRLSLDDLLYIQGRKEYVIIHTITRKIVLKVYTKSMQAMFSENPFITNRLSFSGRIFPELNETGWW